MTTRQQTNGAQKRKLELDDVDAFRATCGERNAALKLVEREACVEVHVRGNEMTIEGEASAVDLAQAALRELYGFARRGSALSGDDVVRAVRTLRADSRANLREIFSDTIFVPRASRPITPKGLAQKQYVDCVRARDIVFSIGPAGTGKTYLAMALAVRALMDKRVKRIVLTRPAVEAGEKLGYLPGTMEDKVNPYLRPLYDALHEMLDFDRVRRLMERGIVEVAPLAFMRGRTLNDSFVILDEAQNATPEQMKMFLTRLGFGSRAVITGDITQSDLPTGSRSGLREARALLRHVEGIGFCYFSEADVVRHPLVQDVIRAYETWENARSRQGDSSESDSPPGPPAAGPSGGTQDRA